MRNRIQGFKGPRILVSRIILIYKHLTTYDLHLTKQATVKCKASKVKKTSYDLRFTTNEDQVSGGETGFEDSRGRGFE